MDYTSPCGGTDTSSLVNDHKALMVGVMIFVKCPKCLVHVLGVRYLVKETEEV